MSARSGKFDENGRDDDLVIETLRKALPDLVAIYRFGSTATGQAVPGSDVDIAVHDYRSLNLGIVKSIVTERLDDFLAMARWALTGD